MSKTAPRARRKPRGGSAIGSRREPLAATRPAGRSPGESAQQRLARLLDTPHLARVVPHLPAETLHDLIRHHGLDACGELLALATPGQLTAVLDLDLWRPVRAGRDDGFDDQRFGEWLEVLVETGEATAARTIAALDANLVAAGLSRYVRVFDAAVFVPPDTDDEPMDSGVPVFSGPVREIGGYVIRARRTDAWDAVVALLLELDASHHECFGAVMRCCRAASNSIPEADGLDDLLTAPEQLLHDVSSDREGRRSKRGYATPADARAFLQSARQPRPVADGRSALNPLAAAYFRAADEEDAAAEETARRQPAASSSSAAAAPWTDDVAAVLAEAGLLSGRPRGLLEGPAPRTSRLTLIRPLIERVRDTDDLVYAARSRELAFLANTLVAGCSVQARSFTPQEAADAAISVCNLGLECWPAGWFEATGRDDVPIAAPSGAIADTFLLDHDLVTAFEVGWKVLHQEVGMFAANRLIVMLTELRCLDAEIQDGLHALRRALVKARDGGTPWQARAALDVIAMLDTPAWVSVLGLLDECPHVPAALTATLERRTGPISPNAFEFIATAGQIRQVHAFAGQLLDVLLR